MPLIKVDGYELEAAEGPFALKVWPPESLGPTLEAYRGRILREGYQVNFNGEIRPHHTKKGYHHTGRKRGLAEFKEEISQKGNGGRR